MRNIVTLVVIFLPILFATACSREHPTRQMISMPDQGATAEAMSPVGHGKVVETMNSGGYTYVRIDTGSESIWAAAPESIVAVGDEILVPDGSPMRNFHSNTLDRNFELIYFVGSLQSPSGKSLSVGHGVSSGHPPMAGHGAMAGHGGMAGKSTPAEIDFGGLEKADGGVTVAEIHTGKSELAGKEVTLRGKVVKYHAQIMGKNWLHIRDGSGDDAAGTNDLTVTSSGQAKVGDTVLVSGKVRLDRDFGHGYRYDVILEDALVAVE